MICSSLIIECHDHFFIFCCGFSRRIRREVMHRFLQVNIPYVLGGYFEERHCRMARKIVEG
jgi:hypothetical protein